MLDEELSAEDRESPRFLAERNQIRVVVPRDMTVGYFLQLYQISQDHVRRQIAEQLGRPSVSDTDRLAEGQELLLELTPAAESR